MRYGNGAHLLGAAIAAAYVAGAQQFTRESAEAIVLEARLRRGDTTKEMASMRLHNGQKVFVPSRKWVDRSGLRPHQGKREMARRAKQIAGR